MLDLFHHYKAWCTEPQILNYSTCFGCLLHQQAYYSIIYACCLLHSSYKIWLFISPSSASWHQYLIKTYSNKIGQNKHTYIVVSIVLYELKKFWRQLPLNGAIIAPKHVVTMYKIVRINYRILQLLVLRELFTSPHRTEETVWNNESQAQRLTVHKLTALCTDSRTRHTAKLPELKRLNVEARCVDMAATMLNIPCSLMRGNKLPRIAVVTRYEI